jgi:hypothetical protein
MLSKKETSKKGFKVSPKKASKDWISSSSSRVMAPEARNSLSTTGFKNWRVTAQMRIIVSSKRCSEKIH